MGWTIDSRKPKNVKEYFSQQWDSEKMVILDAAIVNVREYYAAVKSLVTGEVFGLVVLIEMKDGEFGWKDMDETMGPYYHNCPARILDKLTPTDNAYAQLWRSNCRKVLEMKTRAKTLKTGDVIKFKMPLKFNNGNTWDTFTVQKAGNKVTFREVKTGSLVRITNWKTREFFIITGTL